MLASFRSLVSSDETLPYAGTYQLFAAKGTHDLGLCRLHGSSVGVHWNARACGFCFLVFSVDSVFLGDRHFGRAIRETRIDVVVKGIANSI